LIEQGVLFPNMGIHERWVRNLCETHKIAPIFVYGGEIG